MSTATYVIIATRNQYFLLIVLCLLTQMPFRSQVITEVALTVLDLSTICLQLKIVTWRQREGGRWVGVNSCWVALIATESVSIAFLWLLLPPEVGVNRHGHTRNDFSWYSQDFDKLVHSKYHIRASGNYKLSESGVYELGNAETITPTCL